MVLGPFAETKEPVLSRAKEPRRAGAQPRKYNPAGPSCSQDAVGVHEQARVIIFFMLLALACLCYRHSLCYMREHACVIDILYATCVSMLVS